MTAQPTAHHYFDLCPRHHRHQHAVRRRKIEFKVFPGHSCICFGIDHIAIHFRFNADQHPGRIVMGPSVLLCDHLHFVAAISQRREVSGNGSLSLCLYQTLNLNQTTFQYAIRATFLGFTFSSSILLAILSPVKWKSFGVYGTIMSIFHYSEFLAIAWTNPSSLSTSSFILNHSLHYALAAISSWIEFLVEVNFWPEMKECWLITIVGVVLCVGGELLRKLAIITANTNFNHIVSMRRERNDQNRTRLNDFSCVLRAGSIRKEQRPQAGQTRRVLSGPSSIVRRMVLVVHRHAGKTFVLRSDKFRRRESPLKNALCD